MFTFHYGRGFVLRSVFSHGRPCKAKSFSLSSSAHSESASTGKRPTFSLRPQLLRVERVLSQRGVGTRREVLSLLQKGRVQDERGRRINSGAAKVFEDALLFVDGKRSEQDPVLFVYHKPVGVLTSVGDPWNRPNLKTALANAAIVGEKNAFRFSLSTHHPVGRLDLDTSGLLLLSSDGRLTHRLLSPSTSVPRVYEAIVEGEVCFEALSNRLAQGVNTTDGTFRGTLLHSLAFSAERDPESIAYLNACVQRQADRLSLSEREREKDPLYCRPSAAMSLVRVSVCEGKHRMVRRMLHNAGHSVKMLHRTSYGEISLAEEDSKSDEQSHGNEINEDNSSSATLRAQDVWPPRSALQEGAVCAVRAARLVLEH